MITSPKGFRTQGFVGATGVYANVAGGESHAVSEYDIACYQTTQPQ
jgi:hypothetical protein